MASSSSINTLIPQKKYDVFLSFRGEDTRNSFTSHLNEALDRKGIETFIDDKLVRGDEISESLLNTIEGSTISIIIFSEGYVSSRWCLDELVKILECKNKRGQIVIPVFYHVDPSDVRNQAGNFGNSFSNLEERFKEEVDKLRNWRNALREAASLSGFDSQVTRPESDFIKKIVDDILKKLNVMSSADLDEDLVGIESRIHEIQSLVNYGSTEVYTLGIWGIGGIGKTTLARAIFHKISNNFERYCFIENIREEFEKNGGLSLQRELRFALLGDENLKIGIPNNDFVARRLSRMKVLIIFDDVINSEQIKFLIRSLYRFKPGSLIIITTRDKQILQNCEVKKVYEMTRLEYTDALKLFCQHAFKEYFPNVDYKILSDEVMQYAHGVPLVLGVLGRLLYRKEKKDWESEINKLKRIPNKDIQNVLKVSYNSLDDEERNIFLDVACFFIGENKDHVKEILDASGFSADIGITVLVDKGLIAKSFSEIRMHDLLQEMGREIVRQESVQYPEERSRLLHPKDICEVLTYNKGTKAIQGISLNMSQVEKMSLDFRAFKKMHNLRFLRFYGENKFKICRFGVSGSILTKLRYFEWQGYPSKSLPLNIHVEHLVSLILLDSKVEQLWDGAQNLVNLKVINLTRSNQLRRLPDLSLARNLEKLSLLHCSSLVETHPSIEYLDKLVVLDLYECISLKRLPKRIHSKSLELLDLSCCSNLKRLPEILSSNLYDLELVRSGIKKFPSSMEFLSSHSVLDLEGCSRLKSLPNSLCKLTSLEHLDLSGCSNLQRLPDELGNLEVLAGLSVDGTSMSELPSSIVRIRILDALHLKRCRGIDLILPSWISSGGMHSVTSLKLIDCGITELPESLGQLSSIQELNLSRNKFKRIPESIINLYELKRLDLSNCKKLRSLQKLPCSVTDVNLSRNKFKRIPESIINLYELKRLDLSNCKKLRSLPKLPCSVTDVDASHCKMLEGLSGLSILFTAHTSSKSFQFRNCSKLDQNELRKIVEDGLLKIELNSHAYYPGKFGNIIFPFPEVEIPDWCEYRSMGSSIEFELPSGCNNSLVGYFFFVIVAFGDQHSKAYDGSFNWKFGKDDCDWHYVDYLRLSVRMDYLESCHVMFGYKLFHDPDPDPFPCNCCHNKVFIQFSSAVKKFGIRLLCSKDYLARQRKLKERPRPCDRYDWHHEEEETQLQPKRLKYTMLDLNKDPEFN